MKKIIISFLVIFSLTGVVNAETGKQQQVIIKIGTGITVYQITDRGENDYGRFDFRIESCEFTNPTLSDLKSAGVPEVAWSMCSNSESGFYSSELDGVYGELKDLRNQQADYKDQLKHAESAFTRSVIGLFALVAGLLLLAIIIIYLKMKIAKLESKKVNS